MSRQLPPEQRVLAKHKLVMVKDGEPEAQHLCDVMSWDDSKPVEHGVSGQLEITTRRLTPRKLIKDLPKFRLTVKTKAHAAQVLPFLNRLRKDKQV